MDSSRHLTIKSPLNPDQIRVLSLFHSCEVKVDNKTFLSVWKLVNLGIPPNVINNLLRDVAKYAKN
jgi:hypothetical protein